MLDQSFFVSCPNPQVVRETGLGASVVATAVEGTKKDGGNRPHVAGREKYGLSGLHTELEVSTLPCHRWAAGSCRRGLGCQLDEKCN